MILAALVATRLTGGDEKASDPAPAPAPASSAATAPAPKPAAAPKRAPAPKPAAEKPGKTPASRAAASKPADRRAGLPVAVASALATRKPVVIFFGQKGGADDAATRDSVRAMAHRLGGKVKVVTDSLSNIDDYSLVVRGLGIDQAPSIAIVGRGRKARVLTGYVDEGTLTQNVRDATR